MSESSLRALPAVHTIAAHPSLAGFPPHAVTDTIRGVLAKTRQAIQAGAPAPTLTDLIAAVAEHLTKPRSALRPILNATGVILHTNLGRAPLSEAAALAAYEAARNYTDLELDLVTGQRASRLRRVSKLVAQLTSGEAGTAVNNCAAATVLTLRALAAGREVIVSRGQLVEIGGSYRLPEIMAASGAILREVGTTNITRATDYARAINPNTALILRVHTSNYRVVGFTETPKLEALVAVGRAAGVPVVDDAGSGRAFDHDALNHEPDVRTSLAAGADLVLFSGDKLLGGPQAGLIGGRKILLDRLTADPLTRAFRLDKMTLAALQITLEQHLNGLDNRIQQTLALTPADLRPRAEKMLAHWQSFRDFEVEIVESVGYAGGGSAPTEALPSIAIVIHSHHVTETELARRLREGDPAVLARTHGSRVWLDLRCIEPADDARLVDAIRTALT